MIKNIEKRFIELCTEYAVQNNALSYSYDVNKKECIFTIEQNLIKIEFCYIKKARVFVSPSTLYCRLYLNKNSVVYHHLTDVLVQLKANDFHSCYFSFIENPERMKACFAQLARIIECHLPAIDQALLQGRIDNDAIFESYKQLYKLKDEDIDFNELNTDDATRKWFLYFQKNRDDYLINRFTTAAPYHAWLTGDRAKTLSLYDKFLKKEYTLPYEYLLIDFIRSEDSTDFNPMPDECFSQKYGIKGATPSFSELVKMFFISWVFFALIFCLIFAVADCIISANTVYCFSAPWYVGLIPAGLCAVFGAIATRRTIYRIINKKNIKEVLDADSIANSKKVNVFAYIVFGAAVLCSVFTSIMIIFSYAAVYEDHFKYADDNWLISYSTYSYDDISGVYYIEARYNEYGGRIERPSYVIVTEDKKAFDLDGYATVKESEKTIIPFLREKGFEVIKVDSDKDLPAK